MADLTQNQDFITQKNDDSITIDISKWQGKQETDITITDVVQFLAYEAPKEKELKNLAGISGDWQNLNQLVQDLIEYFKEVNPKELAEEAEKYGLTIEDE